MSEATDKIRSEMISVALNHAQAANSEAQLTEELRAIGATRNAHERELAALMSKHGINNFVYMGRDYQRRGDALDVTDLAPELYAIEIPEPAEAK
jgi:hypothetical protein